jgi:hypothetical protein
MRQTTGKRKSPGERIVKDIKRATRKHYSSEENGPDFASPVAFAIYPPLHRA